jgi:hypothetical protein
VAFFAKWSELKKSAEWMAEGSVPRDNPRFERLRRKYLTASALMAYGFVPATALIAISLLLLLVAILGEHFG